MVQDDEMEERPSKSSKTVQKQQEKEDKWEKNGYKSMAVNLTEADQEEEEPALIQDDDDENTLHLVTGDATKPSEDMAIIVKYVFTLD